LSNRWSNLIHLFFLFTVRERSVSIEPIIAEEIIRGADKHLDKWVSRQLINFFGVKNYRKLLFFLWGE
jgi:hypothetical protein